MRSISACSRSISDLLPIFSNTQQTQALQRMKKILFVLMGLIGSVAFNSAMGAGIASVCGFDPLAGAAVLNGVSVVSSLVGGVMPAGSLFAGVYTEVWTGEMTKAFRNAAESLGWYNRIRSYDQYVENDVIHFVNLGGDPNVLVNNTTYPLEVKTLEDADKAISLDLYETEATAVSDNELYAISYDKMASVIERHKEAINEKRYAKALHAIAPAGDGEKTPVLLTSGTAVDGRKALTREDIIALKKKFDKMKVPTTGRILVLCPDHISDLLTLDQKFAEQYYNYQTGKVANLYGFEVYEYNDAPYYLVSTKAKQAFGVVPTAQMSQASVAFHTSRVMRASGTVKTYSSEAKNDTQYHRNLMNFSLRSICMPLKEEALGAIISASA